MYEYVLIYYMLSVDCIYLRIYVCMYISICMYKDISGGNKFNLRV